MEILLVEDNAGDARLVKEALKDSRVSSTVHVVADGAEALAFLRKEGAYTQALRPDLIVLDLNLPKQDGREVLKELKDTPLLKRIPVVILTSSRADSDIAWAYEQGANCYLLKPVNLEEYFTVVRRIVEFWGLFVRLPPA